MQIRGECQKARGKPENEKCIGGRLRGKNTIIQKYQTSRKVKTSREKSKSKRAAENLISQRAKKTPQQIKTQQVLRKSLKGCIWDPTTQPKYHLFATGWVKPEMVYSSENFAILVPQTRNTGPNAYGLCLVHFLDAFGTTKQLKIFAIQTRNICQNAYRFVHFRCYEVLRMSQVFKLPRAVKLAEMHVLVTLCTLWRTK